MKNCKLGIISGSGLYSLDSIFPLLDDYKDIKTAFGNPSAAIKRYGTEYSNFFFLPRHGEGHIYPPHRIPYRANMKALKDLGITHIIGFCVCGSLKKSIPPGSIVITDQYVDFTKRINDLEPFSNFTHLPMESPFCNDTRNFLLKVFSRNYKKRLVDKSTCVVIDGPKFSTRAESLFYIKNEWDIINMTLYPEVYLAREYGINYASVALVTDYNPGLNEPVSISTEGYKKVNEIFWDNINLIKDLIQIVFKKRNNLFKNSISTSQIFKEFYRNA